MWLSVTHVSNWWSFHSANRFTFALFDRTAVEMLPETPKPYGSLPPEVFNMRWKHVSLSKHTETTLADGFCKPPRSFNLISGWILASPEVVSAFIVAFPVLKSTLDHLNNSPCYVVYGSVFVLWNCFQIWGICINHDHFGSVLSKSSHICALC